ncbi:Protein of unknown function [Gryllus bimaculatus]|nr:Protein of unknown function [Gryllus bimaculatus]
MSGYRERYRSKRVRVSFFECQRPVQLPPSDVDAATPLVADAAMAMAVSGPEAAATVGYQRQARRSESHPLSGADSRPAAGRAASRFASAAAAAAVQMAPSRRQRENALFVFWRGPARAGPGQARRAHVWHSGPAG